MADIDVVPKRRTNMWVWLIVALLVVVALWFMFARGGSSTVGDSAAGRSGAFAVVVTPGFLH